MTSSIAKLAASVGSFASTSGDQLCEECGDAISLSVAWAHYLKTSQATGSADALIAGFHAALIETCAYVSLGLVRPAVFAIRSQVDLAMAWLYFKDHRVEWDRVETEGEGYRLPTDVFKYLKRHFPKFEDRFGLLRKVDTGRLDEPYRLLSAHVHGQNTATIPKLVQPEELVQSIGRCRECITLQGKITEYLNAVFLAFFADEWMDLPDAAKKAAETLLNKNQLKELCR